MTKDTTQSASVLSEREQFEAWIRKDGGDISTFGSGSNIHYSNSAVNNAWTGWQAARAIPPAPGKVEAVVARDDAKFIERAAAQIGVLALHLRHYKDMASANEKLTVLQNLFSERLGYPADAAQSAPSSTVHSGAVREGDS